MPTLDIESTSGEIRVEAVNFQNARNAAGLGTSLSVDLTDAVEFGGYTIFSTSFRIYRVFYCFDVSGISAAPASATLDLTAYAASANGDFILVKGDEPNSSSSNLIIQDWITGITGLTKSNAGGDYAGVTTDYSSVFTMTSVATHQITLNSTALNDIANNNFFNVVLMNSTNDHRDVDPSAGNHLDKFVRIRGLTYGTASERPKLNYTVASAGYTHNVMGVAAANVAKVNGVATANIDKINGVD